MEKPKVIEVTIKPKKKKVLSPHFHYILVKFYSEFILEKFNNAVDRFI